eukprot:5271084-Alexandrium_andersonii.AAC.1
MDFPESVAASQWVVRDAAEYNRRVQNCISRRTIQTPRMLQLLIEALSFDHRKRGFAGLALLDGFPLLEIPPGYRVVEEGPVTDIHKLADLELPAEITFFNAAVNHGLNFVCPLFGVVGFTVECLALDVMH